MNKKSILAASLAAMFALGGCSSAANVASENNRPQTIVPAPELDWAN